MQEMFVTSLIEINPDPQELISHQRALRYTPQSDLWAAPTGRNDLVLSYALMLNA
jgi:hypothetical protein